MHREMFTNQCDCSEFFAVALDTIVHAAKIANSARADDEAQFDVPRMVTKVSRNMTCTGCGWVVVTDLTDTEYTSLKQR